MDNKVSSKNNTGKLVNWITVWGLIFACIAFNLYADNRRNRLDGNFYRTQYEAESLRADSLHRAASQLEQRLQKIEISPVKSVSTEQSEQIYNPLTTREL